MKTRMEASQNVFEFHVYIVSGYLLLLSETDITSHERAYFNLFTFCLFSFLFSDRKIEMDSTFSS